MAPARSAPIDTRPLFRPVVRELTSVLRSLAPGDWERPTVAGTWVVRDVVAHLVDVMLRRVSFHRDRMPPPPPTRPIASERDFVAFINDINAQWVTAARRFSPRVLADLFEKAGIDLADWFEALPLEAPALFGVSWAGERQSEGWFDVGREFMELWHHQQQVRLAVGAPPLADPRYLRAVLALGVRALPHAYRDTTAQPGEALRLDVTGDAGGRWTLTRTADAWALSEGGTDAVATRVEMTDDVAWRLLCNALRGEEASEVVRVEGREELAQPLLRARAVIV